MLGRLSGDRGLCERRSETVADFIYHCRGCCALFHRWRRNLEQPQPAEVRRKRERILMLHHKFQNVSQSLGFVPVLEAHAGAVKRGFSVAESALILGPIPHPVAGTAARRRYRGNSSVAHGENARTRSRTARRG